MPNPSTIEPACPTAIHTSLSRAITYVRLTTFLPQYQEQATAEECLGIAISKFCEWSVVSILEVFMAALEDSNYATKAAIIEEWIEELKHVTLPHYDEEGKDENES